MKKIVFAFGRFNPPSEGHKELITYTVNLAQKLGADHRIYLSQSHDPNCNPLSSKQRLFFLRQIFPGVNFVDDPSANTILAVNRKIEADDYDEVTFVVGADRAAHFTFVKKHNPFKKFQIVCSGRRIRGVSGTDLRNAARKRDFKAFLRISATKDKALAKRIFDLTRSQLNEQEMKFFDEDTYRDIRKHLNSQGWELHRQGTKHDIYAHKNATRRITVPRHSGELNKSLSKEIVKQSVRYLGEDMSRKEFDGHLKSFIDFTCDKLGIQERPKLKYKEPSEQGEQPSFAAYSPSNKEVIVMTKNRHPMDVFRSVAHELVHHKQNEDGRIGKDVAREGATGSDIENEANSRAGELMRWYGKANPQCFNMSYVTEQKAIILAGTPGSGKDKILKEAILPHGFVEISVDTFDVNDLSKNVVVNGVANYERVRYIKEQLDSVGYQTIMVFVNTSNDVSRQRNEARAIAGGRVINEATRYTKWKTAQDNLAKYDQLFEKVIEVKNDLDLNQNQQIIQETYGKLMKSVSKEIAEFALSDTDRRFEKMLNENYRDFSINNRNNPTGGAGNYGTSKLTDRYKADTPGEQPGVRHQMGYYEPPKDRKTQVKVFGNLPKFGDRIGATYTSSKNPSFVGDTTSDQGIFLPSEPMQNWTAIDRWAINEQTRKRFKEKYGKLAEQKIRETAQKLRGESLTDPFMGSMGATPNSMAQDDVRPDINAEFEKLSIFKKVRTRNKLNKKK